MLLKRHYEAVSLAAGKPRVTHVDVLRHTAKWRPSTKLIEKGKREGWLTEEGGKLTLHTGVDDPDVIYDIVVQVGSYCCHCGYRLDEAALKEAQKRAKGKPASAFSKILQLAMSDIGKAHVTEAHTGKVSPSNNNPSGFAQHNFLMCELEVN